MQTLRKKNSPCKYKKEPTRFLGEGVSFKAKLIGILEVSEARGDRMCQAALADLKMAIRAAGEHKQRIAVQVSIDGLRLRDEKSGECLYHHPVHKISFIAQDMSDSRAFGYIFGSPDTGHRFFGIKTDKAANQVVIAMRDLFQVVFELKKKEIELAKHHIEQNSTKFHTNSIFIEPAPDTKGAAGAESCAHRVRLMNTESSKSIDKPTDGSEGVMADLLDLQFELNSIQQGIHQMDKMTPENPRTSTSEDPFEPDPFGDSFINMKVTDSIRPILPPPPSSTKRGHPERQQSLLSQPSLTKNSTSLLAAGHTSPPQLAKHCLENDVEKHFCDDEIETLTSNSISQNDDMKNNRNGEFLRIQDKSPQVDVFTELDPLGTGLSKPYIDKKDFFQHLKNPPKRVLKDLVTTTSNDAFPTHFNLTNTFEEPTVIETKTKNTTGNENFADFDRFEVAETYIPPKSQSTELHEKARIIQQPLSVYLPPEDCSVYKWIPTTCTERLEKEVSDTTQISAKSASPSNCLSLDKEEPEINASVTCKANLTDKSYTIDYSVTNDSPASPLRSGSSDANSRLSSSSAELDIVPEPPPRSIGNIIIDPPPLPPKKQSSKSTTKPPPRPPHNDNHYDFIRKEDTVVVSSTSSLSNKNDQSKDNQDIYSGFKSNDSFTTTPSKLQEFNRTDSNNSLSSFGFQDSFTTMTPSILSSIVHQSLDSSDAEKSKNNVLDTTLNQFASFNLVELAASLNMNVSDLTNLTLQQLTECFVKSKFRDTEKTLNQLNDTDNTPNDMKKVECTDTPSETELKSQDITNYDKYAVFRELLESEDMKKERNQKHSNQSIDNTEENESKAETFSDQTFETPELSACVKSESLTDIFEDRKIVNDNCDKTPINDESSPAIMKMESFNQVNKTSLIEKIEDEISKDETIDRNVDDHKNAGIKEKVIDEVIQKSEDESNDKYAALRDIVIEDDLLNKPLNEESVTPLTSISEIPKTSIDQDLMKLFSAPPSENSSPPRSNQPSVDSQLLPTDIFEEIKMLNSSKPKNIKVNQEKGASGFEDVFCPFTNSKRPAKESKNAHNWAKFDVDMFQSDKSWYEDSSIRGTSPWSPEERELYNESVFKICANRHSGESDNEWKDEEESEESNGMVKDGRFRSSKHPRFNSSCGKMIHYDNVPRINDSERHFRGRTNKDIYGVPWDKCSHRSRLDSSLYHEGERWEEEQRMYSSRKNPYEEDEFIAHRKCRNSQRSPWPGERDAYRNREHPMYDSERGKQRMPMWNEDDRDQQRFSSQESVGYDDEDRWSRREYERKRREDDRRFWGRHGMMSDSNYPPMYRKHSHYHRSDREHLPFDYPPSCEKDRFNRVDGSRRYLIRKRTWPKRPNSANEDRHADVIYAESRMKYGISKSECSDNDSEMYRPYRSKSRESYWDSDQEFDSWGDKFYWLAEMDSNSEAVNCNKRMPRYKQSEPIKPQSSLFEDDFTLHMEQSQPTRSSNSNIDMDSMKQVQLSSPEHSTNECVETESVIYGQSNYFENDLNTEVNASSDPDVQISGSDVTTNINDFSNNLKDSPSQPLSTDGGFTSDHKDSSFNGDLDQFDENAFVLRSDNNIESESSTGGLIIRNIRQIKCNSSKLKENHDIKKSESVNIFIRENDPFDDDDFFN